MPLVIVSSLDNVIPLAPDISMLAENVTTPPEEIDSKDSPGAKKMRKDHEPEKKDNPEAGDDVIKAANAAKVAPKRPGDNAQADKMQKPAG